MGILESIASGKADSDRAASAPSLVVIAANPYSGSGPTKRRVAELVASLEKQRLEPRVIWDRDERASLLRSPDFAKGCRCLVAAGGDGTVADVINEMPLEVPLASLPSGNENLFAREFSFTRDSRRLARAIATGYTRRIDLARACGRLFSLMFSVGFDAAVVHRVSGWRGDGPVLRRVSRLSYAKPIVRALRSYRYARLELDADGRRVCGTHAFVFNLPQYAFQLPFAPDACAEDGTLDWMVFERPGLASMLSYLLDLVRSRHLLRPDVPHGRARRVRITAHEPMPIQMDGEAAGFTPVELDVLPKVLRVIVAPG